MKRKINKPKIFFTYNYVNHRPKVLYNFPKVCERCEIIFYPDNVNKIICDDCLFRLMQRPTKPHKRFPSQTVQVQRKSQIKANTNPNKEQAQKMEDKNEKES
jgi:hypothetical protein